MAVTREKKAEIYKNVQEAVRGAESVVFVNFHGLKVNETAALRKTLKGKEVGYLVAKKTLVKKVLDDLGIKGTLPAIEGELALAFGNDAIVPAKEIAAFQKTRKENISVSGGIFEGTYLSGAEVMVLASIPPREVLYGQFVNIINAPIQGTVTALNGVVAGFVRTLGAIAEKKA
ncbi:50S ribosomal protein L10 [bacterium]|nr:50S ribosomal protein L10 [bacterium]